MSLMFLFLRRLIGDRRGATAVEYGFIVSLIVIAMISSFRLVANSTTTMWGNVTNKVASATGN
jgi:pilus assembly protein Flp/PilA